ncbi:hypothetical protein ACGFI4_08985 [Micromonospora carbonacea]|uniref:hypothetical protein n=1 Tax=Micromonospora carbonacea TaxID=47853 RepID=UPI00371E5074
MRKALPLVGITTMLVGAALAVGQPAQAADEWTYVGSFGACDHYREVASEVRNCAAAASFDICWNDALTDVRVRAWAHDNAADGYHAEARIRYQV